MAKSLAVISKVAANLGSRLMTAAAGSGVWLKSGSTSWIPKSYPWNWWQKDMPLPNSGNAKTFGPVHTCVSIISQDLSRLPIVHLREEENHKLTRVTTKAPARVFRKPNHYQTKSDFILSLGWSLLFDGNFYGLVGSRNERNEIESIYPINPKMAYPYIEPESGEYFYRLGADQTTELADVDPNAGWWVPPRDMLHIRLFTPNHPLVGESPLVAGVLPTLVGQQINANNAAFFSKMSRPSGVLRHPGRLKPEAMARIKERFKELVAGENVGEIAVLAEGMEWQQLQMSAVDADIATIYRLSERQIFQLFRVPLFLGGELDDIPLKTVEALTRFYIQSCLGFYVDHVEESFTDFFGLPPNERIEFDLETALLRGDLKERMEAYGKGVQNGILAPNEARAFERLPPVPDGEQPRVQQQLVPLSFGAHMEEQLGASSSSSGESADGDASSNQSDDGKSAEATGRRLHLVYDALSKVVNE